MSWAAELLGPQLLTKAGEVKTAEFLDGKVVGLYFSAHWCGPCRQFTPFLAKFYGKVKEAGKPFEIVFVSSDRDQHAFDEYYAEHPWVALPYTERSVKEKLSRKYKVRGIPTLVLLDEQGNTITSEGRSVVSTASVEEFPWRPPTFTELIGRSLRRQQSVVSADELKGKTLAIYFSAHWCPPCRKFSPILIESYKKLAQEQGLPFEVIYVSADNELDEYNDYYATMPWLSVDYNDEKTRSALQEGFNVEGFPTLVICNDEGKILNPDARGAVTNAPLAFPWPIPAVYELPDGVDGVNDLPCVLLLAAQGPAEAAYQAVAKAHTDRFAASPDDPPYRFLLSRTAADPVTQQISKLTKTEAVEPTLLLLDIPAGGAFYSYEGEINQEGIEKFIADFLAEKLPRKQLSQE